MHEIMEHDKQQGREMAWHGLTDVKPDLSLENCWLREWDYVANRLPKTPFSVLNVTDECLVAEIGEDGKPTGEMYPLTIGTPFARDSFKPLTNARLLDMLGKVTDGKDLILASVGTVKNRGRHFASFQMGEAYKAAGRDFVPYFNIGNGNDKSSPIWQNTSNVCTVCNNTFSMNMHGNGFVMEVKKTKFSEIKIGDFAQAARNVLASQKEFADMMETLGLVKVTHEDAQAFFAGFIGDPGKALSAKAETTLDRYMQLFKTGAGNNGENFADIFQAGTDFLTHESANSQGDNAANWKNYVSSEFGSAKEEKKRLWAMITVEKYRTGLVDMGKVILKETAKKA